MLQDCLSSVTFSLCDWQFLPRRQCSASTWVAMSSQEEEVDLNEFSSIQSYLEPFIYRGAPRTETLLKPQKWQCR